MRISDWSSDVCSSDLDCAPPQRRGNPPPPGSTRRRLPSPGSRPLQRRSFRLYPSPFAVPSDPRLSLDKCQRLQVFGCLVKTLDADWSDLPIGIGEGGNTHPSTDDRRVGNEWGSKL